MNTEIKQVSALDTKVMRYLELLDEYQTCTDNLSESYKNGFINLSRANYASNRRFNKDFYDHRQMNAVITTQFTKDKFEIRDNLAKQDTLNEKQLIEKHEEQESGLRNRKTRGDPEKVSEIETKMYRNPINMFGGLPPYQLKDSQRYFQSSLQTSIKLINLRAELQALYKEIKDAKRMKN